MASKRYTYIRESESETRRGAIDIHHVIINRSRSTGYARLMGLAFFLVILGASMYFFLEKDNPVRTLSWSCLLSGFFVVIQSRKLVKKESVIIMPTFGIQLETQYLRLQGLTKSVSRYPTFRRHFVELVKKLSNDLDKKHDRFEGGGSRPVKKTVSRIFSQKSFKKKTSSNGSDHQDSPNRGLRDIDIV